jgi:hypothetical protein
MRRRGKAIAIATAAAGAAVLIGAGFTSKDWIFEQWRLWMLGPNHDVFGIQIPASGIFFVIDRSGSFQDSGELALAKREAEEVIRAFPDGVEFGVLFAARDIVRFPASEDPARANNEIRVAAAQFVRGVPGGSASCDRPALLAAIDFARRSTTRADVVIYVTDGGGTCGGDAAQYLRETLEAVTAANQGLARIYSLQIGPTNTVAQNFLRDLAAQNGGEYHEIPLR